MLIASRRHSHDSPQLRRIREQLQRIGYLVSCLLPKRIVVQFEVGNDSQETGGMLESSDLANRFAFEMRVCGLASGGWQDETIHDTTVISRFWRFASMLGARGSLHC